MARWYYAFAFAVVAMTPGVRADASTSRSAKPAKHVPPQFLGKDPHGPLARVVSGKVVAPEEHACTTWGVRGETWKAVDALGRVVGEAKVTGLDRYDVSGCDELTLKRSSGKAGVGVFVRGSYEPLPLRRVSLPEEQRRELARRIAKRDSRVPKPSRRIEKKPELPLAKRMVAYREEDGPIRVVVGGRAFSVFRLEEGRWILEHEQLPTAEEVWEEPDTFMPISVLDMNADGRPEIVLHARLIDGYSDFTLTSDERHRWSEISAGIWGAFA
jgi:hypothetical protein